MYKLAYTDEAKKRIGKLGPEIKRRIKAAVERLAANPHIGKHLTHELSEYWSYRAGDYRILYRVFEKQILVVIVTVGHRKDVYKKASRKWN